MKRFIMLCLISLVMAILSCSKTTGIQTNLGQEVTLAMGQTAVISGEDLSVKLADVLGDSRCPAGVTCIWAGQVSCILDITLNGKTVQHVITASGGTSGYSEVAYQDYNFKFRVEPYPRADITIQKSDYWLVLTINKVF